MSPSSAPIWVQNDDHFEKNYFGPILFLDLSEVAVPAGSVPVAVSLYEKKNRVAVQLKVLELSTNTISTVRNDHWPVDSDKDGEAYVNSGFFLDSRAQVCPQDNNDPTRNKVISSVSTVRTTTPNNRVGLSISWQDPNGNRPNNTSVPPGFVDDKQYFKDDDGVSGLYCDTSEVSYYGAYLCGVQFYRKQENRVAIRGLFQRF